VEKVVSPEKNSFPDKADFMVLFLSGYGIKGNAEF
jgi:hypothetical protein